MPNCFCYFETASSIGVFMVGFNELIHGGDMNCVLIFTPHFFQRYAERMGVSADKNELLMKFITSTRSFTVSPMEPDENGLERITVRITPDCTGHGIRRPGKENVFEVRTILIDAQLSKAQAARTEHVRSLGDLTRFEPLEVTEHRLNKCSDIKDVAKAFYDRIDKLESLGVDTSFQTRGLKLSMTFSKIFMQMGIATIYDTDFWNKLGRESHASILRYLHSLDENNKDFDPFKELVKVAREIAARMGVRKFAWRECAKLLLMDIYQYNEATASETIKELYPM